MKSGRLLRFRAALLLFAVVSAALGGCGGGSPETQVIGTPPVPMPAGATPLGRTPLPPQRVGTPVSAGNLQDLVKQGQAALDKGNLAEAERLFKSATAQDSRSAAAQFGLGSAYYRQGRMAEAETAYQAAIAADPGMTAARSNLGVVFYEQNKMQQATDQFSEILKQNPNDAQALYLLAAVKIQNRQYGEAETLLNRAKAAKPDLAEVYYGLGAVYNLQGKKSEAIAAFEKFLALGTAQDPQAMDEARKQLKELKGQ